MPRMVLTSEFVLINSVNLSAFAAKAEMQTEVDEQDVTTFGDAGWKVVLGGLLSGTLDCEFMNGYSAGEVDATLWPILTGRTPVPVEVRPTSGARSVTNPAFVGNALLTSYGAIAGSVGEAAKAGASFTMSGAVSRLTA